MHRLNALSVVPSVLLQEAASVKNYIYIYIFHFISTFLISDHLKYLHKLGPILTKICQYRTGAKHMLHISSFRKNSKLHCNTMKALTISTSTYIIENHEQKSDTFQIS